MILESKFFQSSDVVVRLGTKYFIYSVDDDLIFQFPVVIKGIAFIFLTILLEIPSLSV